MPLRSPKLVSVLALLALALLLVMSSCAPSPTPTPSPAPPPEEEPTPTPTPPPPIPTGPPTLPSCVHHISIDDWFGIPDFRDLEMGEFLEVQPEPGWADIGLLDVEHEDQTVRAVFTMAGEITEDADFELELFLDIDQDPLTGDSGKPYYGYLGVDFVVGAVIRGAEIEDAFIDRFTGVGEFPFERVDFPDVSLDPMVGQITFGFTLEAMGNPDAITLKGASFLWDPSVDELVFDVVPSDPTGVCLAITASMVFPQDDYADPGYNSRAIDVKFIEDSTVRLEEGVLVSYAGYNLGEFYAVLEAFHPFSISPLFTRPVAVLEYEHEQAEEATGEDIPDLTLLFRILFENPVEVKAIIAALNQLEVVEYASQVPLPMPLPQTPDFSGEQGYLGPATQVRPGLNIHHAWALPGGQGSGISVVDIEYDWNSTHEDISQARTAYIGGIPSPSFNFTNHGASVTGILVGDHQAPNIGVHGLVPRATLGFVAVFWPNGYNIANSINVAQGSTAPGDVILIEQQTRGPNWIPGGTPQFGLVAVEWNQPTYQAIVSAAALGWVVVEAAGNGRQNLDATIYRTWHQSQGNPFFAPFDRRSFDSGAIIVGAGVPSTLAPEPFTNYGSRVDVHAWGSSIITTGYGDRHKDPANRLDQNKWYTRTFGGTSGASAMVASCAVALQGVHMAYYGFPLSTQTIRDMLQIGATPQTNPAQNIGPRPNMRGVLSMFEPSCFITGVVFNDLDGDGTRDAGEPGLPNWVVNLSGLTVTASAVTDASGNYAFNNVTPGTYVISEVLQPGWTQTVPDPPGTYKLTLYGGVVVMKQDFGNR